MKTTWITFRCEDGVELQGLLYSPEQPTEKAVVHVHGLGGNFYENDFLQNMAQTYTTSGYAFLTFNNRGHDYLSDIVKYADGKKTYIGGGAAYEEFKDCPLDIQAALNFMQQNSFKKLILQGHSSGCQKIAYALSKIDCLQLQKIVLISPCDNIGLHLSMLSPEKYTELQNLSQSYLTESRPDKFMPEGTHGGYLLSAKVYNEQYHEGCEQDIFCYSQPELNQVVSLFKCPLLVVFGSRDLILQKPQEIFGTFFSGNKNIQTAVIDGANHGYSGQEAELVDTVCRFIRQ